MIPDNVEKIIMTKEDYDRNVEQLLVDKCKAELEVERLNSIIDGMEKWLKEQVFNKAGNSVDLAIENHSYCKALDKLNELQGDNK